MPMRVETYERPEEAARALAGNRRARFLGGGTLVMRGANEASASFDTIIRLRQPLPDRIRLEGDRLVIGAGATMAQVAASRDAAFLAPAAHAVGGPALRNMATVGGNLFARWGYGDFTTALLALGATVELAGASGRGLPLDDFLRDIERQMGALVLSLSVPRPREPSAFRFLKVTRVHPAGAPILTLAAHLPQEGGRLRGVRIAFGALQERPVRASGAERALEGQPLDAASIGRAADAACDGLKPRDDALASGWYRAEVAGVHLRRLLAGPAGEGRR